MKLQDSLSASFWVLTGHVLGRGSLVLASLVLSHALTTEQFAAFTFFALTAQTIAAYATAGIGIAITMRAAEVKLTQVGVAQAARARLAMLLWATVAIAALAALSVPAIIHWVSPNLGIPALLLGPAVAAFVIAAATQAALVGLERFRAIACIAALFATLLLGLIVLATIRREGRIAMAGLLVATIAQAAAHMCFLLPAVRNEGHGTRTATNFWAELTSTIGPMSLVTVIAASGPWIVGRLLLSGPDGYRLFGAFAIGMQWFSLAVLLPGVVARAHFANLVRAGVQEDGRALVKQVNQQLRLGTLGALTVVLIGALSVSHAASWYGTGYLDTPRVLLAYLLAGGLAGVSDIFGNSIIVRNGAGRWLQLWILWVIALVGSVAFLGLSSAWSAPVALFASYAIKTLVAATVAKRMKAPGA